MPHCVFFFHASQLFSSLLISSRLISTVLISSQFISFKLSSCQLFSFQVISSPHLWFQLTSALLIVVSYIHLFRVPVRRTYWLLNFPWPVAVPMLPRTLPFHKLSEQPFTGGIIFQGAPFLPFAKHHNAAPLQFLAKTEFLPSVVASTLIKSCILGCFCLHPRVEMVRPLVVFSPSFCRVGADKATKPQIDVSRSAFAILHQSGIRQSWICWKWQGNILSSSFVMLDLSTPICSCILIVSECGQNWTWPFISDNRPSWPK